MKIQMSQGRKSLVLKCKHNGCEDEDLTLLGEGKTPVIGATFTTLETKCSNGHPSNFSWGSPVTLTCKG